MRGLIPEPQRSDVMCSRCHLISNFDVLLSPLDSVIGLRAIIRSGSTELLGVLVVDPQPTLVTLSHHFAFLASASGGDSSSSVS